MLQSGFLLLGLQVDGMAVPLRALHKGHLLGYDSLFMPSAHRVFAQCLNYTLVGLERRRATCFAQKEKASSPRSKKKRPINTPVINVTSYDTPPPTTGRGLLDDATPRFRG